MERQYLADVAKKEIETREKDGRSVEDSTYLRISLETGYALLRAARLHKREVPFNDSESALPIVLQIGLENVSGELTKQRVGFYDQSLIFATAKDILVINHIGEGESEAEKRLDDFNETRKAVLQEHENGQAIEAVERLLRFRE